MRRALHECRCWQVTRAALPALRRHPVLYLQDPPSHARRATKANDRPWSAQYRLKLVIEPKGGSQSAQHGQVVTSSSIRAEPVRLASSARDQGVTVRRGQGCTLRLSAVPTVHHQLNVGGRLGVPALTLPVRITRTGPADRTNPIERGAIRHVIAITQRTNPRVGEALDVASRRS